jgi:hypothetical protein
MIPRLLITFLVLLGGYCTIWALPKSYDLQPTALPGSLAPTEGKFELPNLIGYWQGGDSRPASEKEISILSKDTVFNKKSYIRSNPNANPQSVGPNASEWERMAANSPYEEVEVSIVTSGSDMGNSIHRPERCLVAQGFEIGQEKKVTLMVRGKPLPVKRLLTVQHLKDEATGQVRHYRNVTYYWFVGHDQLTNDHYTRNAIDIKDRLLKGYDQQWAYATVGMMLDPHRAELRPDKRNPDKTPAVLTRSINAEALDAEGFSEADRILQEFIIDLAKEVIDRKMISAWNEPAKS